MSTGFKIHHAGPSMTLQDQGRIGQIAYGLSRGGAADKLALFEGAALLSHSPTLPALEMAGMGGVFEALVNTQIALTGARMRANIDGKSLQWNASHALMQGEKLEIGPAISGRYGYLHVQGGFAAPSLLRSSSVHLAAGIGSALSVGECLALAPMKEPCPGRKLILEDRCQGGTIRVVASLQTNQFSDQIIAQFEASEFTPDTCSNRMGVTLLSDGPALHAEGGLGVLSETVVPGDIQITGDGTPIVLLWECQTTGGYPRIGSVLPCDLAKLAQAGSESRLRFKFVSLEDGVKAEQSAKAARETLGDKIVPLLRSPQDIANLLSYQLISGATDGSDL